MKAWFLLGLFALLLIPMGSGAIYVLEDHFGNDAATTSINGPFHEFQWYNNGQLDANLTGGSGQREVNLT